MMVKTAQFQTTDGRTIKVPFDSIVGFVPAVGEAVDPMGNTVPVAGVEVLVRVGPILGPIEQHVAWWHEELAKPRLHLPSGAVPNGAPS